MLTIERGPLPCKATCHRNTQCLEGIIYDDDPICVETFKNVAAMVREAHGKTQCAPTSRYAIPEAIEFEKEDIGSVASISEGYMSFRSEA